MSAPALSLTTALPDPARVALILVAAGRGSRAGEGAPKQFRPLGGRPLLARTLDAAAACPVGRIVVVIHPDDRAHYEAAVAAALPEARGKLAAPVFGGATRQASVRAGVAALAGTGAEIALAHDAARPFFSPALAARVIEAAQRASAARSPALPVDGHVQSRSTAPAVVRRRRRSACGLRAVQTPQAFGYQLIRDAHRDAAQAGVDDLTDDAAVAEWAGHRVHVFPGDPGNMKITTAGDLAAAEARLMPPDIRIGQGYDVHAFGPGDRVWLGGVEIPHSHGLVGHSDADVLIHAVCDAIFGALADGDIGAHFPPSRSDVERRRLAPVSRTCRRPCKGARRRHRPYRCDARLREAEGRPAPRRHSRQPRRADGARCVARRGQGDDIGEARLHRTTGGHGRARDRDPETAILDGDVHV
jgi:2-C-methyl-D-erythritol 4-phosphate cytidylyltransferase/2-C-methyl-D-erythritol 2,4-cyclodiphosphate synthase